MATAARSTQIKAERSGSRGMNRTLPPRDRGNRVADSSPGNPDLAGIVPGVIGLECRTADSREG